MKLKIIGPVMASGLALIIMMSTVAVAQEVLEITKELLRTMLDKPGIVLLDVRREKEWKASNFKIKGAIWEDPKKLESWAGKYNKDLTLIFY